MRLKPNAAGVFWAMYLTLIPLALIFMMCPREARAQTVRIDSIGNDSVRVIVKAGGTTFDTAGFSYTYGANARTRVLGANKADTARFQRVTATAPKTDPFVLDYWTRPRPRRSTFQIVARVAVPPPMVTPPAPLPPSGSYVVPTLPTTLAVAYPAATRRVDVPASANLQAALNAAVAGDELVLADGAQWTGNFMLPVHTGSWITLRGSCGSATRADSVNPSATVSTNNSVAAFTTAPGAHHWYLACFNVRLAPIAVENNNIIRLGAGSERTDAERPSDIVLDRMIVSGSATGGTARCVSLNGARQAVINSRLLECHAKGRDAQAIAGWGGTGPYLIENNTLEASGEVVMFGGSDSPIAGTVPSDITIRRNHMYRPMSWAGTWTIKNLFEMKNAQRVLFEGNVLENNWIDGQVGFAILLKAVSQQNIAPWSTMQDITIRDNLIRNSTSGINLLYRASTVPTVGTSRILFENNSFENVGRDPRTNAGGLLIQLLGEVTDVAFVANTFTSTGMPQTAVSLDAGPTVRLTIRNNLFPASSYGVKGSATAAGNASLTKFAPGGVFSGNVLPGVLNTTGFTTSGTAGVNWQRLNAAIAGVVR